MQPRHLAGAALAASMLLVAACGSSSPSGSGGSSSSSSSSSSTSSGAGPTPDSKVTGEIPASIKSKGTLTVAADATYSPNEFIASDGHTVIGMDADLAAALGKVMGLQLNMVNQTFDSIIPGLSSGKFDLGMSSFTDTKEREKTVDFVTYFIAGTSFYVKASGGPSIGSLGDLCGHKVATEKGTTQADDVAAQAKKCSLDSQVYPDQNGVNLALSSGRADVAMADSPVADYQVKQSNGDFKISGQPYGTAPYGIAIPKGNGMAQPILDALKDLMADGTYKQILDKWGIADGAINNPAINGATS